MDNIGEQSQQQNKPGTDENASNLDMNSQDIENNDDNENNPKQK